MSLRDEFRELMTTLELSHHRRGWDKPAVLYRVRTGIETRLAVEPVRLELLHENPRAALQMIARALELHGTKVASTWGIDFTQTIGQIVITEGWGRTAEKGTLDEVRERLNGKKFADMPGSFEFRLCTGVIGRTTLCTSRSRGEEPVWMDDAEGDVPDALRAIYRATTVRS